MQGSLIAGAIVCLVALLIATRRHWILKKTRDWRPTMGTVVATRTHLTGDDSSVFIDAVFALDGVAVKVKNVLTDGFGEEDFPKGHQIRLLVDPNNPNKCMLETLHQKL